MPNVKAWSRFRSYLLLSRLYCWFWNCTKSCAGCACGLYRQSGISPCPEDIFIQFYDVDIFQTFASPDGGDIVGCGLVNKVVQPV